VKKDSNTISDDEINIKGSGSTTTEIADDNPNSLINSPFNNTNIINKKNNNHQEPLFSLREQMNNYGADRQKFEYMGKLLFPD
jgi:hypothetical protein